MGKTLYLEAYRGISGDMTVGALLGLGADEEGLRKVLDSIPVDGFRVEIGHVKKSGLDCMDFRVVLDAAHENHDSDMEYLYGGEPEIRGHYHEEDDHHHHHDEEGHHHHHDHDDEGQHHHHHSHDEEGHHHHHDHDDEGHHHHHHDHDDEGQHHHHHDHDDEGQHHHHHDHDDEGQHHHHHGHDEEGHHHHEHRGMKEIREIIEATEMTENARLLALRIFNAVAEAESLAHGEPIESVHFHEVGAVDSIVDVIAAAYCLDNLGITKTIVPYLCEGEGMVRCQHGVIPIPVPAVVNIVAAHRIPLRRLKEHGELVTPTGAAIVAAIRTDDRLPDAYVIEKSGLGAGKRAYEIPSILRAYLIREADETDADHTELQTGKDGARDEIIRLETDMDDITGEQLGYLMERLYEAGAREAHYTPIYMKKNRPAYELTVICDGERVGELQNIIFKESTTIGIRRMSMERSILPRCIKEVDTVYGKAKVKECVLPDGEVRHYPEYESVKALARKADVSYGEVIRSITGGAQ